MSNVYKQFNVISNKINFKFFRFTFQFYLIVSEFLHTTTVTVGHTLTSSYIK